MRKTQTPARPSSAKGPESLLMMFVKINISGQTPLSFKAKLQLLARRWFKSFNFKIMICLPYGGVCEFVLNESRRSRHEVTMFGGALRAKAGQHAGLT